MESALGRKLKPEELAAGAIARRLPPLGWGSAQRANCEKPPVEKDEHSLAIRGLARLEVLRHTAERGRGKDMHYPMPKPQSSISLPLSWRSISLSQSR
jgi:hypothetical protein